MQRAPQGQPASRRLPRSRREQPVPFVSKTRSATRQIPRSVATSGMGPRLRFSAGHEAFRLPLEAGVWQEQFKKEPGSSSCWRKCFSPQELRWSWEYTLLCRNMKFFFGARQSESAGSAASSCPSSLARAGSARAAALDAEPALSQHSPAGRKDRLKARGARRGRGEGCTVLLAALVLEQPGLP